MQEDLPPSQVGMYVFVYVCVRVNVCVDAVGRGWPPYAQTWGNVLIWGTCVRGRCS
jgi:hypothetical protein